jgi:acyl carrier protein
MNNKDIVELFFIQREGEGVLNDLYNIDLFESGLIDSLDVVELIVHIEKYSRVRLKLSDSETFDSFSSARRLIELINRKQLENL